ncbi:Protein tyrosine kinase, partial [Rhizoctonia solani]
MESEKEPPGTTLVIEHKAIEAFRMGPSSWPEERQQMSGCRVDIPDAHGQKVAPPLACIIKSLNKPNIVCTQSRSHELGVTSRESQSKDQSSKGAAQVWEMFTSAFLSKVEQWKALRNTHVVSLFGLQAELVIYTEFCVNGTATQYLNQHPEDHINRRRSMISEVLAGVNYLHLQIPPIIHGCICMDKIFVDMHGRAKIGEFALSNLVEEFGLFVPSISQLSRIRWLSPELLDINSEDRILVPTVASDVWALGCTIFEVREIYHLLSRLFITVPTALGYKWKAAKLPGRSNNCLETELSHFWGTLTQCWMWVPGERPTVDALIRTHTQFINLLTAHGCVDITSSIDFSLCSNSPVASGGLGDVFTGQLRTGTRVAIKVFRSYGESNDLTGTYRKAAAREIYMWSKRQHPNVVELIGLAVFRECLATVTEWEGNGNMTHYLSRNPTVNRCELSKSVCVGISYLHSMDIVHGNLKGANVLIDRSGAPKLTDFGCASFLSPVQHFTQTNIRPGYSVRWTAPEILQGKTGRTKEGDIYALGMTILEAFTTEVPFSGWPEISLYQHIVAAGRTILRAVRPLGLFMKRRVEHSMVPLSPRLLEEIPGESEEGEDDEDDEDDD